MALAAYRANQVSEAAIAIDRSIELGKGGSSVDWFFKAMILAKLHKTEEAQGWFLKAESRRAIESPKSIELRHFSEESAKAIAESK